MQTNFTQNIADFRAAKIATALGLREAAPGRWRGPCPVCGGSDRSSKFSLKETGDTVLWRCHAGCGQQAIADELRRLGLLRGRPYRPPTPRGRPRYSRDELQTAAHVLLIAAAALRRGETVTDADRRAIWRAVDAVASAERDDIPGMELARAELNGPMLRAALAGGVA